MFFQQRPAADATLSYFFGCAGHAKAVAVDVVAGDEDWFLAQAQQASVRIAHVIDTHVHADHVSGGPALARRVAALIAEIPPPPAGMDRIVAANLRGAGIAAVAA